MADCALWATACETALWPAGTFGAAYAGNRDEMVDSVIEADPVGSAIRSMMSQRTEWTGTASDLLGVLNEEVVEKGRRNKAWPTMASALSGRVRRAATFLRSVGIDITFERKGRGRTRIIRITRGLEDVLTRSSAPSAVSDAPRNDQFDDHGARTVEWSADADVSRATTGTAPANHPQINEVAAADGEDANPQTHSSGWRNRS